MCGWGEVEDAESGAEPGRTRLFRASTTRAGPRVRGREPGRTRRILYGLRSRLKSRSPDVDGKREPRDQRRKVATHAGGFLQKNRPRVQKHNLFSRIPQTVISHTDTYVSLMESPKEKAR